MSQANENIENTESTDDMLSSVDVSKADAAAADEVPSMSEFELQLQARCHEQLEKAKVE